MTGESLLRSVELAPRRRRRLRRRPAGRRRRRLRLLSLPRARKLGLGLLQLAQLGAAGGPHALEGVARRAVEQRRRAHLGQRRGAPRLGFDDVLWQWLCTQESGRGAALQRLANLRHTLEQWAQHPQLVPAAAADSSEETTS